MLAEWSGMLTSFFSKGRAGSGAISSNVNLTACQCICSQCSKGCSFTLWAYQWFSILMEVTCLWKHLQEWQEFRVGRKNATERTTPHSSDAIELLSTLLTNSSEGWLWFSAGRVWSQSFLNLCVLQGGCTESIATSLQIPGETEGKFHSDGVKCCQKANPVQTINTLCNRCPASLICSPNS